MPDPPLSFPSQLEDGAFALRVALGRIHTGSDVDDFPQSPNANWKVQTCKVLQDPLDSGSLLFPDDEHPTKAPSELMEWLQSVGAEEAQSFVEKLKIVFVDPMYEPPYEAPLSPSIQSSMSFEKVNSIDDLIRKNPSGEERRLAGPLLNEDILGEVRKGAGDGDTAAGAAATVDEGLAEIEPRKSSNDVNLAARRPMRLSDIIECDSESESGGNEAGDAENVSGALIEESLGLNPQDIKWALFDKLDLPVSSLTAFLDRRLGLFTWSLSRPPYMQHVISNTNDKDAEYESGKTKSPDLKAEDKKIPEEDTDATDVDEKEQGDTEQDTSSSASTPYLHMTYALHMEYGSATWRWDPETNQTYAIVYSNPTGGWNIRNYHIMEFIKLLQPFASHPAYFTLAFLFAATRDLTSKLMSAQGSLDSLDKLFDEYVSYGSYRWHLFNNAVEKSVSANLRVHQVAKQLTSLKTVQTLLDFLNLQNTEYRDHHLHKGEADDEMARLARDALDSLIDAVESLVIQAEQLRSRGGRQLQVLQNIICDKDRRVEPSRSRSRSRSRSTFRFRSRSRSSSPVHIIPWQGSPSRVREASSLQLKNKEVDEQIVTRVRDEIQDMVQDTVNHDKYSIQVVVVSMSLYLLGNVPAVIFSDKDRSRTTEWYTGQIIIFICLVNLLHWLWGKRDRRDVRNKIQKQTTLPPNPSKQHMAEDKLVAPSKGDVFIDIKPSEEYLPRFVHPTRLNEKDLLINED